MLPFSLYPRTCGSVALPLVSQTVDEPRIGVEIEYNWLVIRKDRRELPICQSRGDARHGEST